MGMFDDIRCERPLPDGWHRRGMQTKDLDCDLSQYRITAEGTLEVQRREMAPAGPPRQHPFIPSWGDYQPMKCVREWWVPVPYHGDIYFYGGGFDDDWHEYRARFNEGVLTTLIAWNPDAGQPLSPAERDPSGPQRSEAAISVHDDPISLTKPTDTQTAGGE